MSVNRKVRRASTPSEELLRARLVELRAQPLEGRERTFELDRARGVLVSESAGTRFRAASRASAVSYGAPTFCHSSRASWSMRAAPSQSFSASLIRPSAKCSVASKATVRRSPILYESMTVSISATRRPSGLQVAGGDRDLDLRRQPPHARERILDPLERAGDARDRGVDLALGEPEESEPRLRISAELVRGPVGLLRAGEVAAAAPDLADLVVARSRDLAVEVEELLARGDAPGPPQPASPRAAAAPRRGGSGTRRESR